MNLSPTQLVTLNEDIAADEVLGALPHNSDTASQVADAYNLPAAVDYWVWRTSVPVQEIYETTTSDGTTWSWTAYINRSQAERDAWRDLSGGPGGRINAALPNARQGLADIFSGAGGGLQRTHLLTIARRKVTRAEKVFTTGTGSTAAPGTMGAGAEGKLTIANVLAAWATSE